MASPPKSADKSPGDKFADAGMATGMAKGVAVDCGAVRVYGRRWLLLALFVAVILLNALPWLQYCVIENVVVRYYRVNDTLVKWTSLVYNVTAMLLVFPAAWMLDRYVSITRRLTHRFFLFF